MRPCATTACDHAQLLTQERHWDEAEAAWSEVASSAGGVGDREARSRALVSAGDAAFRADRPALALCHLTQARQAMEAASPLGSLLGVQIAGVHMELGKPEAARAVLEEVARATPPPHVQAVLLDTRIGLALASGRVGGARADLDALRQVAAVDTDAAVLFRQGQVDRLEGRFPEATEALASAAVLVRDEPRFDGPLGAILLELAQVAVFREDHDDALSLLDEAEAAWCRARRRSGILRTEAARLHLAASMGACDLVTGGIVRAIAFAAERELRMLETELHLAGGTALLSQDRAAAARHLRRALAMALDAGAPHLAGRARLALHDAVGGSLEELETACAELVETPPWRTRGLLALALARAREPEGRDAALDLASTAFCRFSAMSLPADEARARTLLWQLARRA